MQGYCVRCKTKQEMITPTRTLMKNGRRAMIGHCACCATKMSVAGVWDGDVAEKTTVAVSTSKASKAFDSPS